MELTSRRILFVGFVFGCLWLGLLLRSMSLQIFPQKKLSQLKEKLFETKVKVKSRRGLIYDRSGKELAISIPSLSLFADPERMKEPYYAAKKLSRLFSSDKKIFVRKLLNKKKRFVWIKRHLSEEQVQSIRAWQIKGFYFISEPKRFYTGDNSLAQVLGFTGVDGQGLEGIEKQHNHLLKGSEKRYILKKDARGRPLFADFTPFVHWTSGYNIYLTIDSDLQFYLEKELAKAVKHSAARSAMGLVMEAESSEILAIANIPSYNPNRPFDFRQKLWRNRALTDNYEPGSTLKIFTLAAALKKGIPPTKTYNTKDGFLKVGNNIIREAEFGKVKKPKMDMSEILAFSSNVGAARIALEVGPRTLRQTLMDFGFSKKTGILFPGESKGEIRNLNWQPIDTVTAGFGHGISVTTLQITNAYTSIANGGILKNPILVKRIKNPYNGEEKSFQAKTLHRVLTEKEAHILKLMLTSAVEEQGTGAKARVAGYLSAGKTGTAQMVDFQKGGYKKEYISSFAGFIPAHSPKFVIYVAIEGAKKNFYGSRLAAPVFSKVASFAVRKAGLSPVVLNEKDFFIKRHPVEKPKRQPAQAAHRVPDLRGLTLRQAVGQAQKMGLTLKVKGQKQIIRTQPSAGEPLPENKMLTLILETP